MEETTITTGYGVLSVLVGRHGRSWVARLRSSPEGAQLALPPFVGPDRDSAVRGLTWAVRSLGRGHALPAPGPRPGSWEGCP
jgi:hypothetical protein